LKEREIVDVIQEFRSATLTPVGFLNQLKPLLPRYYSISSTQLMVLFLKRTSNTHTSNIRIQFVSFVVSGQTTCEYHSGCCSVQNFEYRENWRLFNVFAGSSQSWVRSLSQFNKLQSKRFDEMIECCFCVREKCPIYVNINPYFRLPKDPSLPIIMVLFSL
jgi:sulfite reductase alpha subunit-like flavoprotein